MIAGPEQKLNIKLNNIMESSKIDLSSYIHGMECCGEPGNLAIDNLSMAMFCFQVNIQFVDSITQYLQ